MTVTEIKDLSKTEPLHNIVAQATPNVLQNVKDFSQAVRTGKDLYPTSRNEPCEACGDVSGKCRRKADNPNFIACMTNLDSRVGDTVGDWKCVKNDTTWAYFIRIGSSSNQPIVSPIPRSERRAIAKQETKQPAANELSIDQKHEEYTRLLGNMPLTAKHKKNLIEDRGLTEEAIVDIGYKSIFKSWQSVRGKYSPDLPGILRSGEHSSILNMALKGIACPVKQFGKIVALRIRLDEIPESGGRYRWFTSRTKKNPNGATPHIQGELPLAVLAALDESLQGTWVTEGNELKPHIVNRTGQAVLGGARYWHSSPIQAAKFLPEIMNRYGKDIYLALDAGDVQNKGIAPKWLAEYRFFKEQGFDPKFAWWSQVSKEDDDIDELKDFSKITYIDDDTLEQIIKEVSGQNSNDAETEKTPYQKKVEKAWQDSKKLDADIVIDNDNPYFDFNDIGVPLKDNTNYLIGSGMGTGKTLATVLEAKKREGEGIYIHLLGCRNSVLDQTVERARKIELAIQSDKEDFDPGKNIRTCLDSFHKVYGHHANKDLWMDELNSTIRHGLEGGTLDNRQAETLEQWEESLLLTKRNFGLDGNLNNRIVQSVKDLTPGRETIVIKKVSKTNKKCIFYESVDADGKTKIRDRSSLAKKIFVEGQVSLVATDSLVYAESIQELAIKKEIDPAKILLVCSKTLCDPRVDAFLKNPDSEIEKHQYTLIIITPTADQGLSIDIKGYFTFNACFFVGVLKTEQQLQMMNRLRDNSIPVEIFCPKRSLLPKSNSSYHFQELAKEFNDNVMTQQLLIASTADDPDEMNRILHEALDKVLQNRWAQESLRLQASDNYESDNLRECLVYMCKEKGYSVEIQKEVTSEEIKDGIKECKEIVLDRLANGIAPAEPYDEDEFLEKSKLEKQTREVQHRLEKTRLLRTLPGIENEECFGVDFVRKYVVDDRGKGINAHRRFILLNDFQLAQQKLNVDLWWKANTKYDFKLDLYNTEPLRLQALRNIDILSYIKLDPENVWTKDSPDLIALYERLANDKSLAKDLGIQIRKESKAKIILTFQELLKMIGVKLKSSKVQVNGARAYYYRIDVDDFKSPDRLAILKAIEAKNSDWLASGKAVVSWKSDEQHTLILADKFRKVTTYDEIATLQNEWFRQLNNDPSNPDNKENNRIYSIVTNAWLKLSTEEEMRINTLKPRESIESLMEKLDRKILSNRVDYTIDLLHNQAPTRLWQLRLEQALDLGYYNATLAFNEAKNTHRVEINQVIARLSDKARKVYQVLLGYTVEPVATVPIEPQTQPQPQPQPQGRQVDILLNAKVPMKQDIDVLAMKCENATQAAKLIAKNLHEGNENKVLRILYAIGDQLRNQIIKGTKHFSEEMRDAMRRAYEKYDKEQLAALAA